MCKFLKLSLILVVLMITAQTFYLIPVKEAYGKVINLNYASPYSSTNTHSVVDKAWIEKIEKETNGKVKIKAYFGGTLIVRGQTVRELEKGAADISHILPFYEKAGMDLIKGMMSFFQDAPNPTVVMMIYRQIWDEFPELRKELDNVKVLTIGAGTPMYFLSAKKPIYTLDDLKGLRIKGGPEHVGPLKLLGAALDMTPMAEVYIALQKGIVDGVICSYETLKTMRLAEVAKYFTLIPSARGAYPSKAFNWNSWNKLPPDIQKVFEDNGHWHGQKIIEAFTKDDQNGMNFAETQNVEIIEPQKSEIVKWNEILNSGATETAKKLDSKALPGSKIYTRIKNLIQKYNS